MEIQAVYCVMHKACTRSSRDCVKTIVQNLHSQIGARRPNLGAHSSPERLMPQLQIKVPTLRRWRSKIAIAVDRPFFESIGGPSPSPRQDLGDGDIIWLIPEIVLNNDGHHRLSRGHWEILTLEETCEKLLAARPIQRRTFEQELQRKLEPLASFPDQGNT